MFFFFKQKTAYEMRISDWSSDVCSSDLLKRSGADIGAACPLQRVPARARCKARPMLLCQLLQSRLELRRAGGAGMADRATTERRKAGTEEDRKSTRLNSSH